MGMGVSFVLIHGAPAEVLEEPDHDALGLVEAAGAEEADVGVETGLPRAEAAPFELFEVFHRKRGWLRWMAASYSP